MRSTVPEQALGEHALGSYTRFVEVSGSDPNVGTRQTRGTTHRRYASGLIPLSLPVSTSPLSLMLGAILTCLRERPQPLLQDLMLESLLF
jgi:hypothetical protein